MKTLVRKNDLLTEDFGRERSMSEMIDEKLSEYNFYAAKEGKGKTKVSFSDEERRDIARNFDDLIKKYPEDEAFVRSVVISKGMDKKTEQPVIRLGSYDTRSDVSLFPKSKGLESVLDLSGSITYFTIINKPGPDERDFVIEKGDKLDDMEFKKEQPKNNEETPKEDVLVPRKENPEPSLPFEKEMEMKEKRGLGQLLNNEEITNELNKRQKKVLKKYQKEGYKFKKPEQGDIYERVRIKSKEFNESINAWRPKKK